MRKIEMIGKKFGRLTVIDDSIRDSTNHIVCTCICECGNKHDVTAAVLRSGRSKSCGCFHKSKMKKLKTTHGKNTSTEYNIWSNMKARCLSENHPRYADYGGRGIKVCQSWLIFETFYKDMGRRPLRKSLGRINNDGDYCPENCRWETRQQQAANTRANILIEYKGQTKTVTQWAKVLGINVNTLRNRLFRSKWPVEKAFTLNTS